MRQTHVRGIDLGLLTTLQALVEERSITRAAERVHLSQPAMSRAFDRLQELFDDELLVRTSKGYEPTLRALHLHAEIERLLPSLEGLLRGDDFDPSTATDTFRIAATDYATSVVFPGFMARLTKQAPHVALEIFPFTDPCSGGSRPTRSISRSGSTRRPTNCAARCCFTTALPAWCASATRSAAIA
jgi:DNA-binding transcriptional LysR family regulator